MKNELTIDPEFRSMIPPLRPEEREQLEVNIVAEGCRDPLVVWKGKRVLLDGHNRHEICTRRGIAFEVIELELADRDAAADWIDANQLGRRNLHPDQYSLLRGRRYLRSKKREGAPEGNRNAKKQLAQSDPVESTAEKLATQHGVSEATIKRDGQFAAAVEKVKAVDPEIESKVVSGKAPARGLIVEAAKQIDKAEKASKEVAAAPLLGTKKDREAAEVWEKAKDKAQAILGGQLGTIAQAKREVERQEKRAALEAKAKAVETATVPEPDWAIRDGDCVELLREVEPGSVRLIFADPPYNIGIDYGDHHDDAMEQEDFIEWCQSWIAGCVDALTPDGSMWVLINDEWADVFGCMLRDAGLHRRSWIKWYESFGVNNTTNFNRCSRHLFYCVKDPKRFVFHFDAVSRQSERARIGDKRASASGLKTWDDVWGVDPAIPRLVGNHPERLPDFPTQLPLALLLPIVGCASDPGDLVLDPFNGSGTTGAACVRLRRRYVGFEKGPKFAEAARKRLTAEWGDRHREAC